MKKKTYRVTTFAELRRRMEEAQRKAQEEARAAERQPRNRRNPRSAIRTQKEMEVDFEREGNRRRRRPINGFDTHEIVMTITLREKGKTLEQAAAWC